MTIYSFEDALRRRRRLHVLESRSHRMALWRPVPLVSIAYFLVAELVIMLLDNFVSFVSVFDAVLSRLSGGSASIAAWLICYAVMPAGIVWLAMNLEADGRAPHRWAFSCLRFLVKDKHTFCGQRARRDGERVRYRGKVRFWWDVDAPCLQHGWVTAGRVYTRSRVRFAHALRHRHPTMVADARGHEVTGYEVADRLEVRP